MSARGTTHPHQRLGLRAGEWVEVRALAEILETLDERGELDALPFMPEMIRWCGKRLRVLKIAHKTCDRVEKSGLRRMEDTVHLDELRCDGSLHGGCQAGCLIFWKEAWLRRAEPPRELAAAHASAGGNGAGAGGAVSDGGAAAVPPVLAAAVRASGDGASPENVRWSCQATEMYRATRPMKWWDPRPYVHDVRSGNARLGDVVRWLVIRTLNQIQRIPRTYKIVETVRGRFRYPRVEGTLKKTPRSTLDLRPGDRVRVRSSEEIRATLDTRARNRGLSFDMEMVRYCGGTYTVLDRVTRLIDEPTGKMMEPPNDCIILDKVVCTAEYHGLCPRAIYPYWREIWLERADAGAPASRVEALRAAEGGLTAATVPALANEVGAPAAADASCGQATGREDDRGEG